MSIDKNMYRLTMRQKKCLDLFLKADSNKVVAHKLGVTTAAVKRLMTEVYRKLGIDPELPPGAHKSKQLLIAFRDQA